MCRTRTQALRRCTALGFSKSSMFLTCIEWHRPCHGRMNVGASYVSGPLNSWNSRAFGRVVIAKCELATIAEMALIAAVISVVTLLLAFANGSNHNSKRCGHTVWYRYRQRAAPLEHHCPDVVGGGNPAADGRDFWISGLMVVRHVNFIICDMI